ncbi:MAG: Nif3-like dinuclear metal center hexameric protein [Gemmatimonas sp.]|uniref:Nif3-like dinuclear metal center hexameric protein n=1 Tax=Gemmatimonas sp. TaxID=1962908 RepID=UPI00391F134C|nr:Nif3-like dinuclear metal center hexameric protein [Gemmatimonadota bacterium]
MTEPHVALRDLVSALDAELRTAEIPDYGGAVNGLQVANGGTVRRVAVAVDASRAAITDAATAGANLLIVHHGLFWSGAQPLTGVRYEKYRTLFGADLAVYASHLPLDCHPELGNNVRLARALALTPNSGFARYKSIDIGVSGASHEPTTDLVARVRAFSAQYGGTVRTSVPVDGRTTQRWAICTGGGASAETLQEARERGIDTLIVGEGPHHTTVDAVEHDLCVVYAGHYATETLGVQALGAWIEARFGVPWTFLHLPTGS